MRRRHREGGATLIEAALIMPIMILILFGTLEIGLAFKDYLTVSYATREGSRVGALTGNAADADCAIVQSVLNTLGGASNMDRFQQIQIFAADPGTGDRIISKTNTWTFVGNDPYDCANDWTIVENWPSTSRQVLFGPTSELDILGVRVEYTHNWVTGLPPFSGSFTVDEQTITRLEPEGFE